MRLSLFPRAILDGDLLELDLRPPGLVRTAPPGLVRTPSDTWQTTFVGAIVVSIVVLGCLWMLEE